MKNSIISKIIILIIALVLMVGVATPVFADDTLDLSGSLNGGNTETENPANTNTTPEGNDTNTNTNTNTNANANTNTSVYEESNLPYAGPEDTILMVSAFIVFGVIGVYTYIKMSDYSNI